MASARDRKPPQSSRRGGSSRSRAGAKNASGRGVNATSGRAAGARNTARPGSKPARRATERPTQIRRSAAQPMRATTNAAARARTGARGLNSRAITLGVLLIGAVLLLILPISSYMNQRAELESLQQQIADKKASIAELTDEIDLLDDPAYIKSQARDRLNYIEPGEKMYVVANNDPDSDVAADEKAAEEAAKKENTSAGQDLADSIADADGAAE
ncbi:MAG: FtsB family cell division protein [Cumulibacter sp.]